MVRDCAFCDIGRLAFFRRCSGASMTEMSFAIEYFGGEAELTRASRRNLQLQSCSFRKAPPLRVIEKTTFRMAQQDD